MHIFQKNPLYSVPSFYSSLHGNRQSGGKCYFADNSAALYARFDLSFGNPALFVISIFETCKSPAKNSIVSGSRSALFASLITMCIFLIVKLHNINKIILTSCLIFVSTVMLLPYYMAGAQRMINKFESSRGVYGSRTELFTTGVKHFKETPIFGVGFAVSYNELGEKKIGRMESGCGWLSILFQTGLLGFSVICFILSGLRRILKFIWNDYELLLYLFAFAYLCLHSLFEGYLLTIGYYPCILFWCLLGLLYTYPYFNFYKICIS